MRIGLIVYSQTGNTLSVARQLMELLLAAGHEVDLTRIRIVGEAGSSARDIQFETLPDPRPYDALVFCSPVQAFSLCPVMASYLRQMPAVENRKAACLITQALRFAWLGGNRAVGQMTKALKVKGAIVCGSGIVNWGRPDRDKQMQEVVNRLSCLF